MRVFGGLVLAAICLLDSGRLVGSDIGGFSSFPAVNVDDLNALTLSWNEVCAKHRNLYT